MAAPKGPRNPIITIERWLAATTARGDKRHPGQVRLEAIDDEATTIVATWDTSAEKAGAELAEAIHALAQGDCDARGVPTAYQVAYLGKTGEVRGTTAMRLRPAPGMAGQLLDEGPDARGVLGQAMRHLEAVARQNSELVDRTMRMVERQAASLTSLVEVQGRLVEALSTRAVEAEGREAERAAELAEVVADGGGGSDGPDVLERLITLAEAAMLPPGPDGPS